MNNDFMNWLAANGLTQLFTTNAGDTLYVNLEKKLGVLHKYGEYGAQSFFLNDIIEFRTYDDEHLVSEWNCMMPWRVLQRATGYSTNEVYINIRMRNQLMLKLQIFRGVNGNIRRSSNDHWYMFNYACQLSQKLYESIMACQTGPALPSFM